MLVSVVKNWTYPDLLRQTPGGNGVWNNIRFTLEPVDKCDALLVLNGLREDLTICCPPENVWAIFQEPYYPYFFPWMKEEHRQFARVYTHSPPNADSRYRVANPLVPWHVGKTYIELACAELPLKAKSDRMVWVTSSSQELFKEDRLGLSHARNRGWNEAVGEYVAYIDDDAFAPSDWVAQIRESAVRKYAEPVIVKAYSELYEQVLNS